MIVYKEAFSEERLFINNQNDLKWLFIKNQQFSVIIVIINFLWLFFTPGAW